MRSLFRRPAVLFGLALIIGLVLMALWPTRTAVDVAAVSRGPLRVTLDEEGETRVRERFVVSSPVGGRVLRIALEPGDAVRAGQPIATVLAAPPPLLDARATAELRAALEAAEASLGNAEAGVERAAAAVARSRALLLRMRALEGSAVVSRDEVEARDAEVRVGEAALRAATFEVGRARHERDAARARLLQASTVTHASEARRIAVEAPIDAVVLKRVRESEGIVAAGEPLVELGDPHELEIVADYLTTDAVRVRPGAPVAVDRWGGGSVLTGRVRRVEPSAFTKVSALGVEEQRVNVVVDVDDSARAWQSLGDGFRVELRIVEWQTDSALLVPTSSLFRRGDQWMVFAVTDERVRLAPVTIGHRNATQAEVQSGVSEGDRVVLHPPDVLVDGGRIAVRGTPAS